MSDTHECEAKRKNRGPGTVAFTLQREGLSWVLWVADEEYGCPVLFCPWCGDLLQ